MVPHLGYQAHHNTKGKGNVRNFGQRVGSINFLKPNSSILLQVQTFSPTKKPTVFTFFLKKKSTVSYGTSVGPITTQKERSLKFWVKNSVSIGFLKPNTATGTKFFTQKNFTHIARLHLIWVHQNIKSKNKRTLIVSHFIHPTTTHLMFILCICEITVLSKEKGRKYLVINSQTY